MDKLQITNKIDNDEDPSGKLNPFEDFQSGGDAN